MKERADRNISACGTMLSPAMADALWKAWQARRRPKEQKLSKKKIKQTAAGKDNG